MLSRSARLRSGALANARHRSESLQRELDGDLGVLGDERLVGRLVDGELVPQPLGILEREPGALPLELLRLRREPLLPEVERVLGADAPADCVDHPVASASTGDAGVLEERDVAPGRAALVSVEEVVNGRVVLVHGLLDHAQSEHAGVEVDVARRVAGDAGHMVDPVEVHRPERTPR